MSDLPRVKRPCDECPWRRDATPGRFGRERWESLTETSHHPRRGSAPMGSPMFACHKTPDGLERACAGWLAVEGAEHVGVRIAVVSGSLPGEALSPGEGWPELFDTFRDAAEHDLQEDL